MRRFREHTYQRASNKLSGRQSAVFSEIQLEDLNISCGVVVVTTGRVEAQVSPGGRPLHSLRAGAGDRGTQGDAFWPVSPTLP